MSSPSIPDELLRRPDAGRRRHPVGWWRVLRLVLAVVLRRWLGWPPWSAWRRCRRGRCCSWARADMAGDADYFGQLTADGFDVWVYDQIGTGRSSRLGDPRGYTIARGVTDLEAIRQQIGTDRLVLIGHSWGGQVAAAYLAAHPEHVARVVFSSPGALASELNDDSEGLVRGRLTTREKLGLYRLLLRPRVLLGWTLLQVNPRAAHAFVGDAEMDARNDRVYNAGRAGTHCRGLGPGPALHGLGFYAWQFPQSAAARPWADPRPQLARNRTPALVIKGSCDYLSWASGLAYRQALPNAELVYLHHAGHNAYQDQPALFLAVVRAFLTGRPLPIPPWTGGGVPADYEGQQGHLPTCSDGCPDAAEGGPADAPNVGLTAQPGRRDALAQAAAGRAAADRRRPRRGVSEALP